jgi:tryptophan-rich sensory protein
VRGLRKGPLLAAIALPVLFAAFGSALVGGSGLDWYAGLDKPRFLVPLRAFYLVGSLYYALAAIVLYRILVRVNDPRGRALSFGLTVGVLFLNELWNYGFFGLRSTLTGFLGITVFLAPLTALVVALRIYERVSAWLLVPYYVWVLYDLAWTYELWRLNGAAGS